MKVLGLGTDEHVFEPSAARERQLAYARVLGHLDLVVLARRPHRTEEDGQLILRAAVGGSVARLFWAYRLMKHSDQPDVVTVQDPFEVGLVGYFVAKHFDIPLHVHVHTDFLSRGYARHSPVNRVRILLAGFVLRRASRIRVVSGTIKRKIEARYHPRAPITVLPIFVDVETFRNARVSGELAARFSKFNTKLLVVGRLETEKNTELAIRAFAEAAQNDTCLIVVGEGSERARLTALARDLGIADRTFFEGEHPAIDYYPIADLVLVPSVYEGYGLVIVEALAAGKPVLSTDVGIARDAGAIITSRADFAADLKAWYEHGPRDGRLNGYPYKRLDDYINAYCTDIGACTKHT